MDQSALLDLARGRGAQLSYLFAESIKRGKDHHIQTEGRAERAASAYVCMRVCLTLMAVLECRDTLRTSTNGTD